MPLDAVRRKDVILVKGKDEWLLLERKDIILLLAFLLRQDSKAEGETLKISDCLAERDHNSLSCFLALCNGNHSTIVADAVVISFN